MILSERVLIKITKKNIEYYKNIGYNIKLGEIVNIKVTDLTKGSHSLINITCDYCGKILYDIPYKRYIKNTSLIQKYSCSNSVCSNVKIKEVCLLKYGVENPFQADFVKEKSKKTLVKKYGVSHQMYIPEIKLSIKNTCIERYGTSSYTKTNDFKEKSKTTCLNKYGVIHPSKLIQEQQKRKETRIKSGMQVPDELLSDFELYRRCVDNKTNLLKKELFESWDGYDYYDGEYIKDFIDYKRKPSIDHKISVHYGFLNKINIDKIANINNLCITKISLNAQKRNLNECTFKDIYLK